VWGFVWGFWVCVKKREKGKEGKQVKILLQKTWNHSENLIFFILIIGVNQLAPIIKEDGFLEGYWSKRHLVLGKLMENWSENSNLLDSL